MTRMCDIGYRECPRQQECGMDCHFTTAGNEPETRKVKPYPAVPDDIEPVPDQWHKIGAFMLWCIFAVLFAICLALFFTGLWVWSLLI